MMSFISAETNQKLVDLLEVIWNGNRTFDRACTILKVKFNMHNLEKVLHQEYAHFFPAFSDKIAEFMEGYNQPVNYPATIEGKDDYLNPIELIIQLREYFANFRADVYRLAKELENGDFIDYDLKKYLESLNLGILDKMQRLIKIENYILGSLRPDSSMQEIIDLDNFVEW